jgi:hypothetical protein
MTKRPPSRLSPTIDLNEERQASRLREAAAFGAPLAVWLAADPDRLDQERQGPKVLLTAATTATSGRDSSRSAS